MYLTTRKIASNVFIHGSHIMSGLMIVRYNNLPKIFQQVAYTVLVHQINLHLH